MSDRQGVEREAGVVAEGLGIGRVEAGEARRRQPVARRLPLGPRRLQPIAQRHQFIDLGDDAVLFGEGWEGKGRVREMLGRHTLLASRAGHLRDAGLDEVRAH